MVLFGVCFDVVEVLGLGRDWVMEGSGVVFSIYCGLVVFRECFEGVGEEGGGC